MGQESYSFDNEKIEGELLNSDNGKKLAKRFPPKSMEET